MLKQKGRDSTRKSYDLYCLALNTLQQLMFVLRLQKEWFTVTKKQYELDLNQYGHICHHHPLPVNNEQCVRLLTRCVKMYEAR